MFGDGIRKWRVVPRSWKTRRRWGVMQAALSPTAEAAAWITPRRAVVFGGLAVLAVCSAARYFWGTSLAKAEVAADVPPAAADANAPPSAACFPARPQCRVRGTRYSGSRQRSHSRSRGGH